MLSWRLKGFSFLLLLEYPQPDLILMYELKVWTAYLLLQKKVYIFNQSTKNLLEGQLDSIISRAVEHIMMLGFYKH